MDDHLLHLSHSRRDQGDDGPIVRRGPSFRGDVRSAHPELDFQLLAFKIHRREYGLHDDDDSTRPINAQRAQ